MSAWYANHGVEHLCTLLSDTVSDLMRRATRPDSPELFQPPPIASLPSSSVLLPIIVRILRFTATWSALVRDQLYHQPSLVLSLVYRESPVCLPFGVTNGYRLPFICPAYSFRVLWKEHEPENAFRPLSEILTHPDESLDANSLLLETLVRRSIRCSWSIVWHGSSVSLACHCLAMLGALPDAQKIDPIILDRNFKWAREYSPPSSLVALSTSDLALILLSHPVSSCLLSLAAVQQASSHATLVQALSMFLRSVHSHRLQEDTRLIPSEPVESGQRWPDSMCWWHRAQLDRFLCTLPACSADFHLLSSLLDTIDEAALRTTVPSVLVLGPDVPLFQWLLSALVNSNGPLAYCLLQPGAGVGETDSRRLVSAKRRLIYHQLPRLLSTLTARLGAAQFTKLARDGLTESQHRYVVASLIMLFAHFRLFNIYFAYLRFVDSFPINGSWSPRIM
ncbi:unnamed protein product [Echinostoma caproni]|uniref:Uncharacterized protein n=1 Tax=Echinostoma caproni TaxID=27848 RepID=A0A3P8LC97_9TREM|nr:unnamed protein product [Echinostoma caproni]